MSLGFAHTLKRCSGNERPSHVIFADVESRLTPGEDNKTLFTPFLWTMIYKRYRQDAKDSQPYATYGTEVSDFWDEVEAHTYKRTRTYLVTHHLEVDFMPLQGFIYLPERGWLLDKLVCHGRVLIMWWKREASTLIVMNNGNLFTGSIESWGKLLGVPKLTMPNDNAPFDQWVTYCMRDTEVMVKMWDTLLAYLDEHDLGNFKLTAAGLAMSAFRHRFMDYPVTIHHHIDAIDIERASYKGGRFEALKIGTYTNGPYYSLDINSMYGWIEASFDLPYELRGIWFDPTLKNVESKLKRYCVIAEVDLYTDKQFLPNIVDGKVVYRSGLIHTTLTTPELKYSLERGYVVRCHKMTWYYKANILGRYARYFLAQKTKYDQEGNQPMRAVTKLYLNSLYGKFGQKGYEDKVIGTANVDDFRFFTCFDMDTHTRYDMATYGGKIHLQRIM